MSKLYWVPSIERVDKIIKLITNNPEKYRLIDLSNELNINKSSMYSILETLESLNWVVKKIDGTYSLGIVLGMIGSQYFRQFNIVDLFNEEASIIIENLNETVQMSTLNLRDIVYIAKIENISPIKLATSPGSTLPAHSTAMGKVHLSKYSFNELVNLYDHINLSKQTPYTVESIEKLWEQIEGVKKNGFVWEMQESIEGFVCIAAPIKNNNNEILAAISITMLNDNFKNKKEKAEKLILQVSKNISKNLGYHL